MMKNISIGIFLAVFYSSLAYSIIVYDHSESPLVDCDEQELNWYKEGLGQLEIRTNDTSSLWVHFVEQNKTCQIGVLHKKRTVVAFNEDWQTDELRKQEIECNDQGCVFYSPMGENKVNITTYIFDLSSIQNMRERVTQPTLDHEHHYPHVTQPTLDHDRYYKEDRTILFYDKAIRAGGGYLFPVQGGI